MKRATTRRALRLVAVLFDQKQSTKGKAKSTPAKDASWFVCYLTRRLALPGPYSEVKPAVDYVLGDGVAAFAACGFETRSLAGMAREFELDAKNANHRVDPVWVHGCYSVEIAPEDFDGDPEELLEPGHRLMELFGVDKNRYILSVHRDSSHYHVHFLYCRVDAKGLLRERERKQPRFMAEEACAVLAHEFGYTLEAGHLPRAEATGVRDLASGRLTRDANFDCIPVGAQARDKARMKMKGDRLWTVALVAKHVADGDLETFRSLLAEEGISYQPTPGGGSCFVDVDGTRRTASLVDPRLARGKIKWRGVGDDLPNEPEHIKARIAEKRRELATLEVPPSDEEDEWQRFTANRDVFPSSRPFEVEAAWVDKDLKRSFREDRRGAPISRKGAPSTWSPHTRPQGALGSPQFKRNVPSLDPKIYQTLDRSWQTEFWRDNELVATVRYARMAIYSDKEEDLKAALLAAKAAWGPVEIYGNSKFKRRMVKLAAELGVAVSNPELQAAFAQAKQRLAADPLYSAEVSALGKVSDEPTDAVAVPRAPVSSPNTDAARLSPVSDAAPPLQAAVTQPIREPENVSQSIALSRSFISAFMFIEHERRPVYRHVRNGQEVFLLDPAHAINLHLTEADQVASSAQQLLRRSFDQQRFEQQSIIQRVRTGQAKLERDTTRQPVTYWVSSVDEETQRFAKLHRQHRAMQFALEKEWEERVRQGEALAARKAKRNANPELALERSDPATATKPSIESETSRVSDSNTTGKNSSSVQTRTGIFTAATVSNEAEQAGVIPLVPPKAEVPLQEIGTADRSALGQTGPAKVPSSEPADANLNAAVLRSGLVGADPITSASDDKDFQETKSGTRPGTDHHAEPAHQDSGKRRNEADDESEPFTVGPCEGSRLSISVEKPPRLRDSAETAKDGRGPASSGDNEASEASQEGAERAKFEREMIIHITRTERLRLARRDGALLLPDHPQIPAEWHRHTSTLQVELAATQRDIEQELQALLKRIEAGALVEPTKRDAYTNFMMSKFGETAEVREALSARNKVNYQAAAQQALAARRGVGFP